MSTIPSINPEKRDDLAALEENWDGYGAAPPTPEALAVLDLLTIVPLNTGGLQIEWHPLSGDTEIEIAPDGTTTGLWTQRTP